MGNEIPRMSKLTWVIVGVVIAALLGLIIAQNVHWI